MLDAAIIGAGPYGLSAGAHLLNIKGLKTQVFGDPMSFWKHNMPKGMFLRSPFEGSNLSDPQRALTLGAYLAIRGYAASRPVPLEDFIGYGTWFQSRAVPRLEQSRVSSVQREQEGFRLELDGGKAVDARAVIVAAGVAFFPRWPIAFRNLPENRVLHSSHLLQPATFAGRRVAVIGGGQSALECAALLQEAGAQVEIVARQRSIHFLVRSKRLHSLGLLSRLLYAPADVGPAGISRIVAAPAWYQKLPPRLQDKWRARSIRPAGASWLVPRLTDVRATTGVYVVSTSLQDDALTLFLSDGTRRTVDHAVLSTGYAVDVSRYPFFPPDLVKAVEMRGGYPRLSSSFESTVPGLYFIGAPAMWSFGPLMHFVAGADYTARRLASAMGAAVA